MNDIALLAQQAMTTIGPYLSLAATTAAAHVAEGFLSEPGAKLFDWLVAKVKGTPAAATLERTVAEPNNERRLEALRLEIEDLADKDTEFREELTRLLKEISGDSVTVTASQTSTQTGDNNKSAQASGKDINIHIGIHIG
jgi:hypothetical protein